MMMRPRTKLGAVHSVAVLVGDALGADVNLGEGAHPVFLPMGQRAFSSCRHAQIEASLPRVAIGELGADNVRH